MGPKDQPEILSAEARTKQRDQAASELVRGLLLINGGGAAALLAFLQAIWSSNKALARPTIVALVILSVGAVLGAAFHLFRHQASWHHQSGDLKRWQSSGDFILSLRLYHCSHFWRAFWLSLSEPGMRWAP